MGPVNHNMMEDESSYSTNNPQPDESFNPGTIGVEFVRQYYTMLGKYPNMLFR